MLEEKSDAELVEILDGKSRKFGDNAFELILQRRRHSLVIDAVRAKRIRTRDGKIRAMNLLKALGRSEPESYEIFKIFCVDRSSDVVHSALFGLCLWGNRDAIPFLESIPSERDKEYVALAIESIEAGDYNVFSSGFFDNTGVWKRQVD